MSDDGRSMSPKSEETNTDIPHEDDWRHIPDRKAKKRVQNRVAQRSYRQRMKARLEELQAKVTMHEQKAEVQRATLEQSTSPGHIPAPAMAYCPTPPHAMSVDGTQVGHMEVFQAQNHGSQKRKRALSDSEYDMSCDFIQEYPNGMITPGMTSNPNEVMHGFIKRPRSYTVDTPKLMGTNGDMNPDLCMQLPTAPPSLQSLTPEQQPLPSNLQSFIPTPPLIDPQAQLHGGTSLPPNCFTDLNMNPNADGFLVQDNLHMQPTALATADGGLLVGGANFVNNFAFQGNVDVPLTLPMEDLKDSWKATPTPQPTIAPLMGFQASPQSLKDLNPAMDSCSRSPPPLQFDGVVPQEPATKPEKNASMEDRLKYVIDQAKAVGFPNFDDAIIAFYNHTFRESSALFNDQRLSRNRRLPRVLAILRDAAQDWSEWERRGFQEEIIRSAEENLVKEFQSFKAGDKFADCQSVLNQNNATLNTNSATLNNNSMKRKVQDELPNLWALMAALTSKNGAQKPTDRSRAVLNAIGALCYTESDEATPPAMPLDGDDRTE
ncbi:hypothetical protein K461DRAFT_290081 [Myriangium duriaei CBS 260.36]|uniref:BZIP domain-containing protein n=1 Tax=Myriangium duriaei CBS 260.36 TaxID=1168546 RepID=A0A9P4JBY3_9PEZI|nr:hypothetical protein K461DRAFT_290081 [Myriangium duriaei CBS 260.36]